MASKQIRIPFGLDGKTASSGPGASWQNIKLKKSTLWDAAFVEIRGISYGPVLKPNTPQMIHTIEMKISDDYKAHILINGVSVYTDKHYIAGELVISTTTTNTHVNELVDFESEYFYDH